MNNLQEEKLNMYYAVRTTVDKFQATWTGNSVFAAGYNLFMTKIPLIEQNRDAQVVTNTGIATDKAIKRKQMIEKALFIINRLQSYAHVIANSDLFESIRYSATDLKKARDIHIIAICDTIISKATAHVANLAAYGVTQAVITDLQNAINVYSATISKPRIAKAQTKNATENLAILFKEADEILNKRLDLDIEVFKVTKPDFYSQYLTARIILGLSNSTSALKGEAILKENSMPVKGVVFAFKHRANGMVKAQGAKNGAEIIKKSAEKGLFRIQNMPEGTYDVTVKKLGFKEQQLTINVLNGETTRLVVELEQV